MGELQQFFWGFAGSMAVEILDLNDIFENERIRIPARYKSKFYGFVRMCLAAAGGGLAVAYSVQTPMLAFNIGASAHLLIRALSKRQAREVPTQPSASDTPAK